MEGRSHRSQPVRNFTVLRTSVQKEVSLGQNQENEKKGTLALWPTQGWRPPGKFCEAASGFCTNVSESCTYFPGRSWQFIPYGQNRDFCPFVLLIDYDHDDFCNTLLLGFGDGLDRHPNCFEVVDRPGAMNVCVYRYFYLSMVWDNTYQDLASISINIVSNTYFYTCCFKRRDHVIQIKTMF